MSGRSPVSGRYWFPLGVRSLYDCPQVGSVVALDHEAWRVVEVRALPAESWNDAERRRASSGKHTPRAVQLRPVLLENDLDPVKARSRDRHVGSLRVWPWDVYPDPEHYPVCACCGEPMPCRSEEGRKVAEMAVAQMGRFEMAGVCPACEEPVTGRQKSLTYPDNIEVLGGPPVTFHRRGRCIGGAVDYERRWVAADPGRRRPSLFCEGRLTNHNDGTYDCTELGLCPGSGTAHRGYTVCRCPDCHSRPWTWGRGCHPDPKAQLNRGEATA